jgi:HrpA-like RNA helicase
MALDTLVLRLKMLNVKEIFKFAYINKPEDRALEKSIETLQMIGALSFTGDITKIGRLLLQLRIEPFLGRAIV